MDRDTILKQVFDTMAMHNASVTGASKYRMGESVYYVCKSCVYTGALEQGDEALANGTLTRYCEELPPLASITDINRVKPEVLLDFDNIDIPTDLLKTIMESPTRYMLAPVTTTQLDSPGIHVMVPNKDHFDQIACLPYDDRCTNFKELGIATYAISELLCQVIKDQTEANNIDVSSFRPCIMRAKTAPMLVIMLTGETSLVYATMKMGSKTPYEEIRKAGDPAIYALDGWNDLTNNYKRIRKVSKMQEVLNPTRKTPLEKVAATTTASECIAAGDRIAAAEIAEVVRQPVSVPPDAVEAIAAATAAEEQTSAAEEPKQEESAAEAAEPAVEDGAKRKRQKKQAKALGYDYSAVLEQLGAPVADITEAEFDAAIDEVRALRDICMAAARRSANISIQMYDKSKDAVVKMAELRAVLK